MSPAVESQEVATEVVSETFLCSIFIRNLYKKRRSAAKVSTAIYRPHLANSHQIHTVLSVDQV